MPHGDYATIGVSADGRAVEEENDDENHKILVSGKRMDEEGKLESSFECELFYK